jgi:cleavage and polyadenylation specificity factor subunit 5
LSNYTFGTKETQPEEDPSVLARLKRLEEHYDAYGMRRTCEGILVCHDHNHPHVLMLQIANAFFKLPGDYLPHDADEIEGFKMRLNERLAPSGNQFSNDGNEGEWEIGETLAQWWRPNFETFMYPSSRRTSLVQRSARSCTSSNYPTAVCITQSLSLSSEY